MGAGRVQPARTKQIQFDYLVYNLIDFFFKNWIFTTFGVLSSPFALDAVPNFTVSRLKLHTKPTLVHSSRGAGLSTQAIDSTLL